MKEKDGWERGGEREIRDEVNMKGLYLKKIADVSCTLYQNSVERAPKDL